METRQQDISDIERLLELNGFELEKDQPHIGGERFLLAPNKLVLVGKQKTTGVRVIIKVSNLSKGKQEIKQEKLVKDVLSSLPFSRKAVFFPNEIFYGNRGKYLIMINEFIEQEKVFISYSLEKQYQIILQSFKKREALDETIYIAFRKASKEFLILNANDYLENFLAYKISILKHYNTEGMKEVLNKALQILNANKKLIELYGHHLVHGDFVPHNFRIKDNKLYMLDCSAFHFGNKYEEWARLLNYMVIHNPSLEMKLKRYIFNKKDKSHYLDLKMMRIYKIGFLLDFYARSLPKTSKDLHALTVCRIEFWEEVLRCVIQDNPVNKKIWSSYIKNRDNLRSVDEKKRQREFTLV